MLSRVYFSVLNRLCDAHLEGSYGTLTLFSRKVRDAYVSIADRDRHHVMILQWLGYRSEVIDYEQPETEALRSAYGSR